MSRYRFRLLWATLALLLFFYPIIKYFELTGLEVVLNATITLILIASIHAVSDNRRHLLLALAMIAPAIALSWTDQFLQPQIYRLVVPIFLAMAFGYVAVFILRFALKTGRVDAAKVDAAICVYLLIGVVWQYFYIFVNSVIPGSFANPRLAYSDFLYFSFVTLTTLGYGDITPLNGPAQALAYTEAILGQLYLTILVARLVGLHIAYTGHENANDA